MANSPKRENLQPDKKCSTFAVAIEIPRWVRCEANEGLGFPEWMVGAHCKNHNAHSLGIHFLWVSGIALICW